MAIYVADAQRLALPIVGERHDWNWLLTVTGLLAWTDALGRLVFLTGVVAIAAALGLLGTDVLRALQAPLPAVDDGASAPGR